MNANISILRQSSKSKRQRRARFSIESLEDRLAPAIDIQFALGVLTLTNSSSASENVQIGSDSNQNVTLNGVAITCNSSFVAASDVGGLVYNGGSSTGDSIDFSGVHSDNGFQYYLDGNVSINGSTGNDSIIGSAYNDSIVGGDGNDTIFGGDGNDFLDGGIGNDSLLGEYGDDYLVARFGNDVLGGGDGNDTLDGSENNDTLFGDEGDDILVGGSGDDTYAFKYTGDYLGYDAVDEGDNAGIDTLDFTQTQYFGISIELNNTDPQGVIYNDNESTELYITLVAHASDPSIERVYGSGYSDYIHANIYDNTLIGGGGNDIIGGDAGNDSIVGDDGDDTLFGDNGSDTILGGANDDWIYGANGASGIDAGDNISGGDGNDTVYGEGGDDLISGGAGDDELHGDFGTYGDYYNVSVFGPAGDDTIEGGTGDDSLYGGRGDDTYKYANSIANYGDDVALEFEDQGFEVFDFTGATVGIQFDLSDTDPQIVFGVPNTGSYLGLTLAEADLPQVGGIEEQGTPSGDPSFEGVYGGSGNDDLRGNGFDNYLSGGPGNDTLLGGGGNDTLFGGSGENDFPEDQAPNQGAVEELTEKLAELELVAINELHLEGQALIQYINAQFLDYLINHLSTPLGLEGDYYVFIFDPVDFTLTDASGNPIATNNGATTVIAPGASAVYLTADGGNTELLIVSNASPTQYSMTLTGVGNGNYAVGSSLVQSSGTVTSILMAGKLSGSAVASLDFSNPTGGTSFTGTTSLFASASGGIPFPTGIVQNAANALQNLIGSIATTASATQGAEGENDGDSEAESLGVSRNRRDASGNLSSLFGKAQEALDDLFSATDLFDSLGVDEWLDAKFGKEKSAAIAKVWDHVGEVMLQTFFPNFKATKAVLQLLTKPAAAAQPDQTQLRAPAAKDLDAAVQWLERRSAALSARLQEVREQELELISRSFLENADIESAPVPDDAAGWTSAPAAAAMLSFGAIGLHRQRQSKREHALST